MAAWFDRIAIYGPAPPKPKKDEKAVAVGQLQGLVPTGDQAGEVLKSNRTRPKPDKKALSSGDCWLPGYEYLMAYYLHPRETPRCKYSNTVFRPLALHDVAGTAPRPQSTPTPPNPIWGGPSPIAQGAVPDNFGKRSKKKHPRDRGRSFRKHVGIDAQHHGAPRHHPEAGEEQEVLPRVSSPSKPHRIRPEGLESARLQEVPTRRPRSYAAWRSDEDRESSLDAYRSMSCTPTGDDRFSLRSSVMAAARVSQPTGYEAQGARKEDSRAFRFVRKLYNTAHRENFALKKIAEQEEQVYGEALGGSKKGKRRLPGWLAGKKETLCNDGSHFTWVCQY